MSEIYNADQSKVNTRSSYLKLKQPFQKTTQGQRSLSYIGPALWNSLPENIKRNDHINTFKHNIKRHYLDTLRNN